MSLALLLKDFFKGLFIFQLCVYVYVPVSGYIPWECRCSWSTEEALEPSKLDLQTVLSLLKWVLGPLQEQDVLQPSL